MKTRLKFYNDGKHLLFMNLFYNFTDTEISHEKSIVTCCHAAMSSSSSHDSPLTSEKRNGIGPDKPPIISFLLLRCYFWMLCGATGAPAPPDSAASAQSCSCIIHTVCPEDKALHTHRQTQAAEGVERK